MPRRVVLAVLGGILISGTVGAVAAAADGPPGKDSAKQGPEARGTAEPHRRGGTATTTPPQRHGTTPPQRHGTTTASAHEQHPRRRGEAPRQPVFYVGGPMTVALTLDDGPSPVYTPQVLRILQQHGVTATFSMVGQNVASYRGIVREVAGAGHMIANHTWSHPNMAALPAAAMRDQVTRTGDEVHAATGQRPAFFRAPYGAWSPALLDYLAAQQLTPLAWSVDPRDWARPGVTSIIGNILRTTRAGSIILEHDGGGDRSQTVAALKIVLPRLLDEGFRFRLP
jgi:peptidoglycan/xylan/chitin deacetylase (PgdA/CDA1 family)